MTLRRFFETGSLQKVTFRQELTHVLRSVEKSNEEAVKIQVNNRIYFYLINFIFFYLKNFSGPKHSLFLALLFIFYDISVFSF